ncbi:flagellar export protein FliJ [Bacillus sp. BRMEA1]|uniref:flagellar export protein FliJ n=1 Tax=Neobacillus endophyticus TaxID=2738405 RepID=UPI0015643DB8|nr:flagellar export protein FliJ [Neobacillus endophyticus]NRD79411.1 flagellar export protein FliJ [Neobacillus endophyticus]
MKFQFSFQKVLDFKEKEKEAAEQEFGTIRTIAMELEEKMGNLEQVKENAFTQYNHVDRKTIWEMIEFQQEIEHINKRMKELAHQSQQVHQQVEQKQQVLIEKTQEAKMWNQWKSKSLAIFQRQMEQKEQAMLDEMAVLRYARKI